MSVLTLLVGIPGSGIETLADELIQHEHGVLLNADNICPHLLSDSPAKNRHEEVYNTLAPHLINAMQTGRPIVLDARLHTAKFRRPYVRLAHEHGYRVEAIFCNALYEQALEQVKRQQEAGGPAVSESTIRRVKRYLRIPTYAEGFDRVEVRTYEPVNEVAARFFHDHEQQLLSTPSVLIRELERDGSLALWLPELYRAIPIDQHNPHHRFTVYEHILKASETVAGTSMKMIWTMLLHDIGKAYPGIKQFTGSFTEAYGKWRKKQKVVIENGADIREGRDIGEFYVVQGTRIPKDLISTDLVGHFYDHENLGAQMAFRVLTRFGYPHDFALEVATLVQFHMMMPRNIEDADLSAIRWWLERVGPYAADLMLVRLADTRGK